VAETISAYMQCYNHPRAVYETLKAFRGHYPEVGVSLVSDAGYDFKPFAKCFDLRYTHANEQVQPKGYFSGRESAETYLKRVYDHCISETSDWVVLLEEDVITKRRALHFPESACAGARSNPFSEKLTAYFNILRRSENRQFYYGLCGGSCFSRAIFLECYSRNRDLRLLHLLDDKIYYAPDATLTSLFTLNGYNYSEWAEVSELSWARPEWCVMRDGAFDHANKQYYTADFDPSLLQKN
jgi:hypothetical protein